MTARKRIAITGSTGIIGASLVTALRARGRPVVRLVRPGTRGSFLREEPVSWDPGHGFIERDKMEGLDAVIHLAGENLAGHRWSAVVKDRIRQSRTGPARFLAETLMSLKQPPAVVLSASAIGYYGLAPVGTEGLIFTEKDCRGEGFLADVCDAWETAWAPVVEKGIRVVYLRFGMVLSKHGGALARMLPVFRLGLGGPLGRGLQPVSWVALEEIPLIAEHILSRPHFSGPVNVTAPESVTNLEFTRALAALLRKPAVLPVPAWAVKIAFGEMGEDLLLSGARVHPRRLRESGYIFRFPDIATGLASAIGHGGTQNFP